MQRVILAGPDVDYLSRAVYPAFAAVGMDVEALASTSTQMAEFSRLMPDAVVVVDAALFADPDEALGMLSDLPNPKVIILPQAWSAQQAAFAALPNLVAGFTAPVSWPAVVTDLRSVPSLAVTPTVPPVPPPPSADGPPPVRPIPPAQARPVRIGFWGTRGGVGTSTAALRAAQMLAAGGRRVLLCDATGRGDLHVMLGVAPQGEGTVQAGENLFVRLGVPAEGEADGISVVVDGGRHRRSFNAEWVEVSKPLSDDRIRRLLGLPPPPEGLPPESGPASQGKNQGKKAQRKVGFIRLEIT